MGLWELEGASDRIRLRGLSVDEAMLGYASWVLFGSGKILDLHGEIRPLYDRSRKTRKSIMSAMPQFDYEGLVEGAVLGEAGVCGGIHEGGSLSEPGAGEDEGAHREAVRPSVAAPAGLDSEGEGRAEQDRQKRSRSPSPEDGGLMRSSLGTSPEKTPVAAAASVGGASGHRAGATGTSGIASSCFTRVRKRVWVLSSG